MEQYSTETRLMLNQQYTVVFNVKGEETLIAFTSEYSPLFSSAKLVRSSFKKLFADYTDDEINRMIHENSKLALELANPEINIDDPIPYYVKQYVRYKTELDLLIDIIATQSITASAEEKLLGDMKISKEQFSLRDIKPLIALAERRLAPWEAQLSGMRAAPSSAIRAGANEYPLNPRNSF